jgi:hypothetical protein
VIARSDPSVLPSSDRGEQGDAIAVGQAYGAIMVDPSVDDCEVHKIRRDSQVREEVGECHLTRERHENRLAG